MTDAPDPEFHALTDKISRERGFACASYKERCLRRRIAVRMRARGVHTFEDYARLLDRDTAEYDRLLDALTINVTKFFRNPEVWDSMARSVIPRLLFLDVPVIRVWSAGCASGEEAYTLAILFHREAVGARAVDRLGRIEIVGTDVDPASLEAAERAQYDENDFADTPPAIRRAYFDAKPPFSPAPMVRAMVRFHRRDLIREAPPGGDARFQLIVCRNVLIYFDRTTQEALFEVFHRTLAPNGILVLGKVETLLGEARKRFTPIDTRERIFARL
jgi:chemotaxis protein methyltransferase CheR